MKKINKSQYTGTNVPNVPLATLTNLLTPNYIRGQRNIFKLSKRFCLNIGIYVFLPLTLICSEMQMRRDCKVREVFKCSQ